MCEHRSRHLATAGPLRSLLSFRPHRLRWRWRAGRISTHPAAGYSFYATLELATYRAFVALVSQWSGLVSRRFDRGRHFPCTAFHGFLDGTPIIHPLQAVRRMLTLTCGVGIRQH